MRVNSMITPIGMDRLPVFSWKMKTDRKGARQTAYRIIVSKNDDMSSPVWDTGKVNSDKSVGIKYGGGKLAASVKYWWKLFQWDENDKICSSEISWFETGLMGEDMSVWNGAEWIGNPIETVNTSDLNTYSISVNVEVEFGNKAGIAVNARNKDNYVLVEFDIDSLLVNVFEYSDDAWDSNIPYVKLLKTADIPKKAAAYKFKAEIIGGKNRSLAVNINNVQIFNEENIIPKNPPNMPKKENLMSVGFKQYGSRALYRNVKIENTEKGIVYQEDDFSSNKGLLCTLGEVSGGILEVKNRFELICPVPAVNLKKKFSIKKEVKSARLYSSARGFYEAYINGEKISGSFYNPGFTDYRLRIYYQTYDVTEFIKQGKNIIGAVVGKGMYSGYCGYSGAQIYGNENSFIGKLLIKYTDGTEDIIVTDGSWLFTDKGAVVDSDCLDGETYDARLETDWDFDDIWKQCGVKNSPSLPKPTNGFLENVSFKLSAQDGSLAMPEKELDCKMIGENPKGHFVYDFGQNMVGTIRLKLRGKRGTSIKIRYGEMVNRSGEIYIKNLRTAANTDVYTLKGDEKGETFVPSFTSHGFRYAEITGNGFKLDIKDIEIIELKGIVINNLGNVSGSFECSNENINKLQKNIQWGQRGNYLLTLTDCPQRNERMGWTGDAQVFAETGAYNMDVEAFTRKWLKDVKDGQLMYNKNGAVPDTAPIGGDNREDGCAGWGDAAVIVPWEIYRAYGDITVLEECYDMMSKWIEYQSRDDRQNYGLRTVDGKEVPEKSDLASIPFIQVQQRRGDHLSFDCSTPYILSATAYAAHVSDLMSKIAGILNKTEDEKKYRKRFENIKRAFNEAWVQEDGTIAYWGEMSEITPQNTPCIAADGSETRYTYYSDLKGSIHHPSQTAYALAIDFDLIPKEKMHNAARAFKRAIEERNSHLSVGFLGISHLASALTKAGLTDAAFSLLEQEENPGWLYSVINGATTIWERWDSYIAEEDKFGDISMNSFNHYAYGAIGAWMFNTILGIAPCEAGYKSFLLKPETGGNLTYAKGSFESPYGKIISGWSIEGDILRYKCTVPPNTKAKLYLPLSEKTYELDCGNYEFIVKLNKNN